MEISALLKKHGPAFSIVGLAVVVFVLTFFSYVSNADSDPHLSLLVSQAIIEHGTIKLDAYQDVAMPPFDSYPSPGPFVKRNGHYYYYYPIGSSVFSAPFVFVANLFGKDMADSREEHEMQNVISSFLCALVCMIVYGICRCYVDYGASLVITLISTLGSSLVSTMGTALWSINWTAFFVSLALWLIVRWDSHQAPTINPYLLGFLLFAAFFCRASAASFILVVLAYLLWRDRILWLKTAVTSALFLLLFLGFSWREFGTPLPQYYSLARFTAHKVPLWMVLYGHLLSPSRGILVYSPFFALTLGACWAYFRDLQRHRMFWFGAGWFILHLGILSRSTRWWGGHAFGPRILTEAIPALVLLTAIGWRILSQKMGHPIKIAAFLSYTVLGLAGIFINSHQGLYNANTARWNGGMAPDVDWHPEYLLNWDYPQFLATRLSLCRRNLEFLYGGFWRNEAPLRVYSLGEEISYQSGLDDVILADRQAYLRESPLLRLSRGFIGIVADKANLTFFPVLGKGYSAAVEVPWNALFIGWSWAEKDFRWSECPSARIIFRLGNLDRNASYRLTLSAGSYFRQEVLISVNGVTIGNLVFPGPHFPPSTHSVDFSGALLKPQDVNEIEFQMPYASSPPDKSDPRQLGLAFRALTINSAVADVAGE